MRLFETVFYTGATTSQVAAHEGKQKHGLSKGAIIGIAVAAVVAAVVLIAVIALLIRRQNEDPAQATSGVNASGGSGRVRSTTVDQVKHLHFVCFAELSVFTNSTGNSHCVSLQFWWRSPLWSRGTDHSPTTTQALAGTARV